MKRVVRDDEKITNEGAICFGIVTLVVFLIKKLINVLSRPLEPS
jgi:hypothetical protein